MTSNTTPINPGHSLGPFRTYYPLAPMGTNPVANNITDLGASLHEVLTVIKQDQTQYSKIDLLFDRQNPLETPTIVSLPQNGLRLRFDGADQRLRLVEIVDFRKINLAYKGSELVKTSDTTVGPSFRRIYQIFGATYPGEYHAPENGRSLGQYVLSWTGVAFTFPFEHSAWSADKDHVSLLGSSAASSAKSMALFEGSSWPDVRKDLFVRVPVGPRSSALASKSRDSLPAELQLAKIQGHGQILFQRRSPASPFSIVLNETTPQDLITELGPPDATHKRDASSMMGEQPMHKRTNSSSNPTANGRAGIGSQPSSYSSTGTDTYEVDFDSGDADEDSIERASRETFWCYFNHGMDILVGPPSADSYTSRTGSHRTPISASPYLVVTKIIIHGNVPGSYAFNRHRRLRWQITLPNTEYAGDLTSETKFDNLNPALMHIFQNVWPKSEMGKGKVVNRTWGAGPSDSTFFLPDANEDLVEGVGSEQWLGNTRLYTFPGLVFEVLENGAVSAVTVYQGAAVESHP